ncbi:MAG: O-antigen ligase family protein [Cyclobacteriaceae bacterium]
MTGNIDNRSISIQVFLLMIFGTMLIDIRMFPVSLLGKFSVASVLVLGLLLNLQHLRYAQNIFLIRKMTFWTTAPLIVWFAIYLYGLSNSSRGIDFYITAELFFIISFFVLIAYNGHLLYPTHLFIVLLGCLASVNFFVVIVETGGNIVIPGNPGGLFGFRTSLASASFYMMIFYCLYCLHNQIIPKKILVGILLLMIYLANSRSVYGAVLFFGATFHFWPILTKYKLLYFGLLASIVFLAVFFILLMVGDLGFLFPDEKLINTFFRLYTGGSLYSGREQLWPDILYQINLRPWLGHGPGYMPSDFLNTGWSSHNYYLQIILQTGFVGLSCLIMFIIYAWNEFRKFPDDNVIRLLASAIISILAQQIFVVSLTQNKMEQAIYFWYFIGLALNRTRKLQLSGFKG